MVRVSLLTTSIYHIDQRVVKNKNYLICLLTDSASAYSHESPLSLFCRVKQKIWVAYIKFCFFASQMYLIRLERNFLICMRTARLSQAWAPPSHTPSKRETWKSRRNLFTTNASKAQSSCSLISIHKRNAQIYSRKATVHFEIQEERFRNTKHLYWDFGFNLAKQIWCFVLDKHVEWVY